MRNWFLDGDVFERPWDEDAGELHVGQLVRRGDSDPPASAGETIVLFRRGGGKMLAKVKEARFIDSVEGDAEIWLLTLVAIEKMQEGLKS